jgi:hypothetical protein
MDDVDSRPLGTPEESHSPSISEAAEAGPAPQVASQVKSVEARSVARGFLIAAALIALADTMAVPWLKHELPNALVVTALALALAGIAVDLAAGARSSVSSRSLVLERALTSDGWCAIAVGILFLAFYAATISPPTQYNEHARLAWALLHGHTWVDVPSYMEHVVVGGRSYILHPPLSAILMLPAVAIWGAAANQTAVSVVLGAISIALWWRLMGRLGLRISAKIWLSAFMGVGTTLWYEATLGSSWDFALLASVPFTLAALGEVFGEARPWAVGVLAALAALARYDLVMAWPMYALMLAARGRRLRELAWMLPGFAVAALVYVGYNEVRFGTPNDIALWIWYGQDKYRLSRPGGPFALRDLPLNLYTLLFMAPGYTDKFPWIHPEFMGQALILMSPAFVLALRPSFLKPLPALVLAAAVLSSGPSLLVYASGFAQLGPRYYVQVYPFLLTLIALGAPRRLDQLTKILIVISIALVVFFTWQVRWYGWGG